MRVTYIDHMGSDLTVADAARVSFAKSSSLEDDGSLRDADARLIRYLARHNHWSPFAHPQISLHIRAPIFIARQLAKHQAGLTWNEISRRYVDAEPEAWKPQEWRGRADNVKQGSGEALTGVSRDGAQFRYWQAIDTAMMAYQDLLDVGVCPEQARAVLPLATNTEWIWTGSLAAFARVVRQRIDGTAQAEAGEIARQISTIIAPLFPASWAALMEWSE